MRNCISILIVYLMIISCSTDKSTPSNETIYVDKLPQLDSGSLVRIIDKDGNVIRDDFESINDNIWMESSELNGDIFYDFVLDSVGNKTKTRAFKYNYRSEYFSVDINNDTILIGDEFIGYIGFNIAKGNKAIINTEDSQVIIKENDEQNGSSAYQVYEHRVKTKSEEIKDFKGKLIIDGKEYPFEYKYVVITKDSVK